MTARAKVTKAAEKRARKACKLAAAAAPATLDPETAEAPPGQRRVICPFCNVRHFTAVAVGPDGETMYGVCPAPICQKQIWRAVEAGADAAAVPGAVVPPTLPPPPPEEERFRIRHGLPEGEVVETVEEGGQLYLQIRWKDIKIKAKAPTHLVDKPPATQKRLLSMLARQMRAELERRVRPPVSPAAVKEEQRRRRAGRIRARKEMSVVLSQRVQKLQEKAKEASKLKNCWRNPEMYGKALGARDAAALMVGRDDPINIPRPPKWLDDGATVREIAELLGITAELSGETDAAEPGAAPATDEAPPTEPAAAPLSGETDAPEATTADKAQDAPPAAAETTEPVAAAPAAPPAAAFEPEPKGKTRAKPAGKAKPKPAAKKGKAK